MKSILDRYYLSQKTRQTTIIPSFKYVKYGHICACASHVYPNKLHTECMERNFQETIYLASSKVFRFSKILKFNFNTTIIETNKTSDKLHHYLVNM